MIATASRTSADHLRDADGNDVERSDVAVVEVFDRDRWEGFLDTRDGQTLYHRWAWSDVLAVYGLSITRLATVRGGRITGVLPLVRQRSRLFGDRLASLPWFDAAGILADTLEDRRALADAAVRRAEAMRVGVVEIRECESVVPEVALSPHVRSDKVLLRLPLTPDAGRLWDGLRAKVRNQIRKGERSGLRYTSGGIELLPEFFAVYSRNMRDLGSPSHAPELFEATCAAFPQAARLHVVTHERRAVGAALTLALGEFVEVPWASSLREANGLCVNHVLYWNLLQDACRSGRRMFHFGRSSLGSGTYHFKKQWGAEDVPLSWYHLGRAAAASVAGGPHVSFAWAAKAWQRLPMWMARRLGPRVIANVS